MVYILSNYMPWRIYLQDTSRDIVASEIVRTVYQLRRNDHGFPSIDIIVQHLLDRRSYTLRTSTSEPLIRQPALRSNLKAD